MGGLLKQIQISRFVEWVQPRLAWRRNEIPQSQTSSASVHLWWYSAVWKHALLFVMVSWLSRLVSVSLWWINLFWFTEEVFRSDCSINPSLSLTVISYFLHILCLAHIDVLFNWNHRKYILTALVSRLPSTTLFTPINESDGEKLRENKWTSKMSFTWERVRRGSSLIKKGFVCGEVGGENNS